MDAYIDYDERNDIYINIEDENTTNPNRGQCANGGFCIYSSYCGFVYCTKGCGSWTYNQHPGPTYVEYYHNLKYVGPYYLCQTCGVKVY